MAAEYNKESTSLKVKRSVSQLALAFAVLGFIAGLAVMSPDGRFAGFALTALCGAVPLVLGPSDLRKYGALAAVAGTIGVMVLAGTAESSPYRTKARLQAVNEAAAQFCKASAAHRERTKSWPASLAGLEVPKKPRTVTSIALGPDGAITFVLSFPPVKDKALVYTPAGGAPSITWTCRGRDIPAAYLPEACKE
jgi:hypothetical protein